MGDDGNEDVGDSSSCWPALLASTGDRPDDRDARKDADEGDVDNSGPDCVEDEGAGRMLVSEAARFLGGFLRLLPPSVGTATTGAENVIGTLGPPCRLP